jgi:hypothetical protein
MDSPIYQSNIGINTTTVGVPTYYEKKEKEVESSHDGEESTNLIYTDIVDLNRRVLHPKSNNVVVLRMKCNNCCSRW